MYCIHVLSSERMNTFCHIISIYSTASPASSRVSAPVLLHVCCFYISTGNIVASIIVFMIMVDVVLQERHLPRLVAHGYEHLLLQLCLLLRVQWSEGDRLWSPQPADRCQGPNVGSHCRSVVAAVNGLF